ncbi:MAG: MoaD/ThiS family protein [Acidimicrobiaceae bacterium]|nr:MoaD/ThiS family protein [Acidimicrobiaceae bacterium]MCY4280591.1 MoaD/ThiS family protein [Acidimicrobiaceae bacterium]MCY4293339.1 MoaD/ThiS family protein [Acidimicrobiaceae bacterium]
MAVRVHLSSNLRGPTGGVAEIEGSGANVGALIGDLERQYPGLGDALRSGVSVVIDGLLIAHPQYYRLADGAQVFFVPQSAGG